VLEEVTAKDFYNAQQQAQQCKSVNLTPMFFFLRQSATHFVIRQLRIQTSSICNNALHDLTLIKATVFRILGTEGFLNRYSNGHKKYIAINGVPRLFKKNITPLIKK
jgi:hypothetical protein